MIDPTAAKKPVPPPQPTPNGDASAERPVINYRSPDALAPVTGAERIAILAGYVLILGGFGLAIWALPDSTTTRRIPFIFGVACFVIGAAITIFCFIVNAVRRM